MLLALVRGSAWWACVSYLLLAGRCACDEVDRGDRPGPVDSAADRVIARVVAAYDGAPYMTTAPGEPDRRDVPPSSIGPGTVLGGRYRLEDLLTDHDGARFWRATDTVLARSVAVHAVASDDARAPGVLEAARLSARVTDPHFLRVLDCDDDGGLTWVINEWGEGVSLDRDARARHAAPDPSGVAGPGGRRGDRRRATPRGCTTAG